MPISSAKIIYITGEIPRNDSLVPTNQHPFDHFAVVAYFSGN